MHRGAQQPGMTGQVKEDILSRWGELGITIEGGQLAFRPELLRKSEFLTKPKTVHYTDIQGKDKTITLAENQLFFTYGQVLVIYILDDINQVEVAYSNGTSVITSGQSLSASQSNSIFSRKGEIDFVKVNINHKILK
jgi:hypothetical protein